jgi:serine/threonine protein kinase
MTTGYAPSLPRKAQPLTRMAADAVAGGSGVDVEGYRDYRGVHVVGAWTWLPELGIGVTTEIDSAETYAALDALERRFAVIIGLLMLGSAGLFLYTFVLGRLHTQVDEVRQLGRYRIERRLGRGGMGTVYLASHALLRRPTAIKVLRGDSASPENVARFEREVQVSSSLSHPNTIEIYDFGRTPDGTFYYAMEYVSGVTLGTCVEGDGPQPEARVVYVLRQACASIAEAHAAGLIHRDLKPSNVMLCERGGLVDFVKVLDFGLVKQEHQQKDVALTDVTSLTGTPLYLPPEAVQSPETLDVRADLYQLGAIGYYFLVGRHVFRGDTPFDVLAQHVGAKPEPPSAALGRSVSPDLEQLILRCLEKDPEARHANAGELLAALERCTVTGQWGQTEAREWWGLWWQRHPPSVEEPPTPSSHPSGYSIDMLERLRRRS